MPVPLPPAWAVLSGTNPKTRASTLKKNRRMNLSFAAQQHDDSGTRAGTALALVMDPVNVGQALGLVQADGRWAPRKGIRIWVLPGQEKKVVSYPSARLCPEATD